MMTALIKKKIKFSSFIRKFSMEQLQSHIWLTTSSYMGKYMRISSYIRKPFLIYDFATALVWISLHLRKIWFSFLSVWYLPGFSGSGNTAVISRGTVCRWIFLTWQWWLIPPWVQCEWQHSFDQQRDSASEDILLGNDDWYLPGFSMSGNTALISRGTVCG